MEHWDNFIIVTGKIGYIDDEKDIYEILLSSGDDDSKSVFVVKIFSELLENMMFYATGNDITIIGHPITDERCRITIFPHAIIIEDKQLKKKKIYFAEDNDEEEEIEYLEDLLKKIKMLLSDSE